MELRHLRYFIAVALEENVSKAALKLHVSQPALSRQVKDLEDELGIQLLERSAKSVRLTEAGHAFLEEASDVLEHLEEGITRVRDIAQKEEREIHISYAPSLTPRLLPPILRAFQKKLPKVKVKLHDLSTEETLQGIQDGSIDFGLLAKPSKSKLRDLTFETLAEERIILATSPENKYASENTAPISSLKDNELVTFNFDEYPDYCDLIACIFGSKKKIPKPAEASDSASSLITSIEIGNHVAIVTESISCVAGPRLKLIPLSPEPAPLEIGLLWKERVLREVESKFLEAATGCVFPHENAIRSSQISE